MRTFGPIKTSDGYQFRLWAPHVRSVALVGDHAQDMARSDAGWFSVNVPGAAAGSRYAFRIDDALTVPDPASRFQPDDVFGLSEIVDDSHAWRCADWRGRAWRDAVILEIHIGTFTAEGTFRAAIDRLDHVAQMGFTAIELMPIADWPGRRNWGYDGVLWYAPDSSYGRPDDLKRFIDEAHARNLMVFLDVVYNHFGPEGNYLGAYAPGFFDEAQTTPWGAAIDYRVPEVRAFAIENALHWLDAYRFDGLRLDAVHAVATPGTPHILTELSEAVGRLAEESGRVIHLMLENDDNAASLLEPTATVPRGRYRAQWNDDYHHAWHVLLTGEQGGYYGDYADDPADAIARTLSEGFLYQGQASPRHPSGRGEASRHLSPLAFVNFLQNHDQIGNRAFGERLTQLAAAKPIECALAVTLLAPSIPMLFMGEEWDAAQPFPFFCDFSGDLAEAIHNGRRREFAAQFAASENPPDALSEQTFLQAKLDWSALERPRHAARRDLVRELLGIRREYVVPLLERIQQPASATRIGDTVLSVTWRLTDGGALNLLANVSDTAHDNPTRATARQRIWGDPACQVLEPWSVHWWVGDAA